MSRPATAPSKWVQSSLSRFSRIKMWLCKTCGSSRRKLKTSDWSSRSTWPTGRRSWLKLMKCTTRSKLWLATRTFIKPTWSWCTTTLTCGLRRLPPNSISSSLSLSSSSKSAWLLSRSWFTQTSRSRSWTISSTPTWSTWLGTKIRWPKYTPSFCFTSRNWAIRTQRFSSQSNSWMQSPRCQTKHSMTSNSNLFTKIRDSS